MTLSVGVLVGDSVFSFSSFLMEMRMEIWTFFVFLFFLFRSSFPDCSSDVSKDLDSFRRLFLGVRRRVSVVHRLGVFVPFVVGEWIWGVVDCDFFCKNKN